MPNTKMAAAMLALGLGLCAGACSRSPAAPTPSVVPPVSTPPIQHVFTRIVGYVADTAFRPLAGVDVEVLDGAQAGAVATSDASGRFSFSGTFGDAVTVRATKGDYLAATQTFHLQCCFSVEAFISIRLGPLVPPLKIEAGDYALTVIADSACADIPSDLRTRTYSATVMPVPTLPGNTLYSVTVSGPSLDTFGFGIGVAGNYVAFTIDGPEFFEHLPQFTYLEIFGAGSTSVETPPATISIPFGGSFEYCVLKSEMGRSNCFTSPASQKITYSQCLSENNRMILTRR